MCFLQTSYFENFQDYRKKRKKKRYSDYPYTLQLVANGDICYLSVLFLFALLLLFFFFHLFLLFLLLWLLLSSSLPFFSSESCENKLQRSLNYFWNAGVPHIWKTDIGNRNCRCLGNPHGEEWIHSGTTVASHPVSPGPSVMGWRHSLLMGEVTSKSMTKNIHWMFPKHLLCSGPYAGGWVFEDEQNPAFSLSPSLSHGMVRQGHLKLQQKADLTDVILEPSIRCYREKTLLEGLRVWGGFGKNIWKKWH